MFKVNSEKCIACKNCIKDCTALDIILKDEKAYIKNESCIKCGHCIAICPTNAVSTDDFDMNQVIEYDKENFSVDADNLLNFIKFRRSVRRFKNKEIEIEKLKKIIETGRVTETGANKQDVSFTVITGADKLDKLKNLTYEALNKKGQYILNNLTPETQYLEIYAKLWIKLYELYKQDPIKNDRMLFNAPAVIVITSDAEINGVLASSNMELMINALKLGTFFSGFIQIAAKDNQEMLDFLKIKNKKIAACLVLGYPDVTYKRTTPKKEADITWL